MSQTTTPPNAPEVDVLAVLDCFINARFQVCCGNTQGGGHDENGDGEPPQCCGQPLDSDELWPVRAAVAALLTREAALVAEVDLLRRVQASMATEGVALVAERDALIDERDQLNSDYLTAINAANVIAAENKALREALIDVRDNVRDNSPVMWHRVDAALALGESRSDG